MSPRSLALMLVVACSPYAPTTQSAGHFGAATCAYELTQRANAVALLERDYLASIEAASGEELFDLYRNYNRLIGTWVQVDLLQGLLEDAIDDRHSDAAARSALRDQANYLSWELDTAIAGFENDAKGTRAHAYSRLAEDSLALLSNVRVTVDRLYLETEKGIP